VHRTVILPGVALILGVSVLISGLFTIPDAKSQATTTNEEQDWRVYGARTTDDHYSNLSQINRDNVKTLAVAWTFDTGEKGWLEANPIVIEGVLYTCTPHTQRCRL
jgi:quinoprotein glucose dehydrogenase